MELASPSAPALPAMVTNDSGGAWTVGPGRCSVLRVVPDFVEWSVCSLLAAGLLAALFSMCLFCYHLRFQNWVISRVRQAAASDGNDLLDISTTPKVIEYPELYGFDWSTGEPMGYLRRGRPGRAEPERSTAVVFSSGSLRDGGSSSSEAIFEIEDLNED